MHRTGLLPAVPDEGGEKGPWAGDAQKPPRNKGGRPKGAVDPLSASGRRRLIVDLHVRAQHGDAMAARQLIELSQDNERKRTITMNNGEVS